MKYWSMVVVILCCLLLGSCSKYKLEDIEDNDAIIEVTDNPFDSNDDAEESSSTESIGGISHGITDKRENLWDNNNLLYKGGEITLDYFIVAEGIANKSGFLVFVDGIPQPYKINDTNNEYKYMHEFILNDGELTEFKFIFTPVTGVKGDTLPIAIISITNPLFKPNMIDITSYGYTHQILECNYNIYFEQSFDNTELKEQQIQGITFVESSSKLMSKDEITEYENQIPFEFNFEKDVYIQLFIEDENMKLEPSYFIDSNEKLNVNFKILGHPGLIYRNVLYYDHTPIYYSDVNYFQTKLQKGYIEEISFEIDLTQLEPGGTFYVISIPINSDEYPNDVIVAKKFRSIYLYDNVSIENNDKNEQSKKDENKEELSLSTTEGTMIFQEVLEDENIQGVFYGGEKQLLIQGEDLFFYHIMDQSNKSNITKKAGLDEAMETYILDSGYAILGTTGEEEEESVYNFTTRKREIIISRHMECTFYDNDLKELDAVDIPSQIGINITSIEQVAVSKDGAYIACIGDNGIYIYNRQLKNTEIIAKQNIDNYDYAFTHITFLNTNHILFLAQIVDYTDKNQPTSYSAYGVVSLDGTEFTHFNVPKLGKLERTNGIILMSQKDILETPIGEAFIVQNNDASISQYKLKDNIESENLWLSNNGEYFASSVRKEKEGWIIRIYEISTGNNVFDKFINLKNTDDYKEPIIRIFDEENKIFLYYKSANIKDTKAKLFMGDINLSENP